MVKPGRLNSRRAEVALHLIATGHVVATGPALADFPRIGLRPDAHVHFGPVHLHALLAHSGLTTIKPSPPSVVGLIQQDARLPILIL